MKKITTIEELMNTLEGSGYFGLRGASKHDLELLERGYLDCSYVWEDGEITNEQLSGTCAVGVSEYLTKDEIKERYSDIVNMYCPAHETNVVLLINDKYQKYGNDENEVILGSNGCGADVIAIVKL